MRRNTMTIQQVFIIPHLTDFSLSPIYQEGAIYIPVYSTGYANEIEIIGKKWFRTYQECIRFFNFQGFYNPRVMVISPQQIPYLVPVGYADGVHQMVSCIGS